MDRDTKIKVLREEIWEARAAMESAKEADTVFFWSTVLGEKGSELRKIINQR